MSFDKTKVLKLVAACVLCLAIVVGIGLLIQWLF